MTRAGDSTVPSTMRTAIAVAGTVRIEDRPTPVPGPGQVLVRSTGCGICGSDLHIVRHFDEMYEDRLEPVRCGAGTAGVLLGHELSGEVVGHGPGATEVPVGTRVASVPFVTDDNGDTVGVGLNQHLPGAFSEFFVLDEATLIPVPDHVSAQVVTLAEPLAVAIHAVGRGRTQPEDTALVIGCGAVGLATIAALRIRGVETIVASDPIAHRRTMAAEIGATHTIDPLAEDEMLLTAELGQAGPTVIFECAGVTSMVRSITERAPHGSRIVIVGVHSEDMTVSSMTAMRNELDISFTFYYSAEEYAEALAALAAGTIDLLPLVTGQVGLDGLAGALDVLLAPNDHIKIIVNPWSSDELPATKPAQQ